MKQFKVPRRLRNLLLVLAGNALYALAVDMFVLPCGLITGGTTGLALIRCVDPDGKTDAADTLAIGNSLWAPVYGSMPALLPLFAVTIGMFVPIWLGFAFMVVPLVIGFVFFRKK